MNLFVFDIKTIPDVDGGRRLYELEGLTDKEVANVMFHKRRQETGNEFLRLHLNRVVAISVVLRSEDNFSVYSLGGEAADEKEIIEQFFNKIEKHVPTLVSWNGKGFDLPVLHYRSMVHGVQAPKYWEIGDNQQDFQWNNYLNRYHRRHTDLMDVLAGYEMNANTPLNELASLLGFPGKMNMNSNGAWDSFQSGQVNDIRNYCEIGVLNTYLIYLRFELINGNLSHEEYEIECDLVQNTLTADNQPHLTEFLNTWQR